MTGFLIKIYVTITKKDKHLQLEYNKICNDPEQYLIVNGKDKTIKMLKDYSNFSTFSMIITIVTLILCIVLSVRVYFFNIHFDKLSNQYKKSDAELTDQLKKSDAKFDKLEVKCYNTAIYCAKANQRLKDYMLFCSNGRKISPSEESNLFSNLDQ